MSLPANVNKLIREHPHRYETSYKVGRTTRTETEWLTRPPLLLTLRQSIRVANDRAAGGSTGAPSPLNMPAFSLYEEIRTRAETLCADLIGKPVTRGMQVEDQLEAWAFYVENHDVEQVPTAIVLTGRWVDAITELFQPVRRTEIVGACPSCGERWTSTWAEDETKRTPALQAVGATVTCQICKTEWTGMQLHFLKLALDTAQEKAVSSGETIAK